MESDHSGALLQVQAPGSSQAVLEAAAQLGRCYCLLGVKPLPQLSVPNQYQIIK